MTTHAALDRPFATVPRLTDGGVVVCVAPGPSLVLADVEHALARAPVILISDAVRTFATGLWTVGAHAWRAAMVYSSDKKWWMTHWRALREIPGHKVRVHNDQDHPTARPVDGLHCPGCRLRLPDSGNPCWCARAGLVTLKNLGVRGLSLVPDGICTGNNSGTASLNVALLAGATRIVLLGFDMGPRAGRQHFYDAEPVMIRSPFMQFRELTAAMAPRLVEAGVEVVNCSRDTDLDCFPRVDLREALP